MYISNKYFSYFREATSSDSKFVLITSTPGKGCVASLGFVEMTDTYLNLDEEWCFSPRNIMHELFHTLGVSHYHQRSDRDKYVKIHWDNITPDLHFAYCKDRSGDNGESSTYGTDYDFKSFMHYMAGAGALDRSKPTISSKVKSNL